MSELHDSSLRIHRKRRRQPPAREPEVYIQRTPLQRRLLWGTVFLFSLSALVLTRILCPAGVGVGTLHATFSHQGDLTIIFNEERGAWSGVSTRVFGLGNYTGSPVNPLYYGGSWQVNTGSSPFLAWVRCERFDGGPGFWFGLVY